MLGCGGGVKNDFNRSGSFMSKTLETSVIIASLDA